MTLSQLPVKQPNLSRLLVVLGTNCQHGGSAHGVPAAAVTIEPVVRATDGKPLVIGVTLKPAENASITYIAPSGRSITTAFTWS